MEEGEFNGAYLLKLASYCAPLNPIEECWSVFKSEIMKLNMNGLQYLLSNPIPEGTTQTVHYLLYLENLIALSMTKITPLICIKTFNHVQMHFHNCLALKDLDMGDII